MDRGVRRAGAAVDKDRRWRLVRDITALGKEWKKIISVSAK